MATPLNPEKLAEEGFGTAADQKEQSPSLASLPAEKDQPSESTRDPFLVTWDGPHDPDNPKNWAKKRKWAATFAIASFTFISPISSTIVAPAIDLISKDLNITSSVEQEIVFSVFVLGYAFGPLILGPLSEIYGRPIILQLANLFYLIFNTAGGWSRTKGEMIAFRFLSGLGGSAPLAIGGGVIGDTWRAEERAAAISIYSLAPLLGPAIGPVAGGWIAERTTWRWVFWAPSIADVLIQVLALFVLQETWAPKLLLTKARKLRAETKDDRWKTQYEIEHKTLTTVLIRGIARPFILISTQPIVQALGIYMAYLYGVFYLVLGSFSNLWTSRYSESVGIAGLNYISISLGAVVGALVGGYTNKRIYTSMKVKNNNVGKPELRLILMIPGSLLVPIGLFWYGWSAQERVHWIVPNLGILVYLAGGIVGFQCIQTYIVDAYTTYAASTTAAVAVARSLLAFVLPLAAPKLYATLDYGWGNSTLAFIAIALGVPSPLFLWKYGPMLRAKSPYAAGGGD